MISYFSLSRGRFGDDVIDGIHRPRVITPKAPVLFMHGAGANENARQANNITDQKGLRNVLLAIAGEGHIVVAVTAPDSWGNATFQTRATQGITYARGLGAVGPAVLVGASHGGACVLTYAVHQPAEVACVIGLLGAVDLNDIRDNNIWGIRPAIDAAWGVTYPAPLPVGANPAQNTAALANTPIQWWYASDDPVTRAAPVEAFAAATNVTTIHNVGALGHTDAAALQIDPAQVLSFIGAHT